MTQPQTEIAAADAAKIDWPAVFAQNQGWMRAVILARLGEPQAVDEVLQEVSLAAVRQTQPLRDPSKLAPWLYRLAVTQTLLYRRKRGRRRKMMARYAEKFQPTEADVGAVDPLGWLLADERQQRIRTAMQRLAPKDAEILMLKYTQNWSYHQLAVHVGVSESALEARLHRARARLRQELAELEVIEKI